MGLDDTQVLPVAQADTPTTRCKFYRQVCGLAAVLQPEAGGRIIVPTGSVGAITMPAPLGASVKNHMLSRTIRLGPIISHPRSKRWTFLARPDVPDEVKLFAELFRLNVSVSPFGAQIALPSPTFGPISFRTWVQAPYDSFRPSGLMVVESIRACARPKAAQNRTAERR
ncbi:DNA-directed RNA polymerase subunit beta [Nocardia sp. R7R-8]|uniref:DNA-directed RNA polymerase subunit beta n=1 Tax=Nocardia sp. R7R-8 TaxID=3459304 RepID=UPI00403D9DB7